MILLVEVLLDGGAALLIWEWKMGWIVILLMLNVSTFTILNYLKADNILKVFLFVLDLLFDVFHILLFC